uniref:Endonuclease/exonuclease/phosphatase domain-containing protein n=1 Tax=Oryza meridionalis TaxID=40149 RepID=A0A0E0EF74_9ORYZ
MLRRVLAGFRALHPRPRRRRHGGAEGKARVTVRRLGSNGRKEAAAAAAGARRDNRGDGATGEAVTIRVATFNAAMFSMAPAVAAASSAETATETARRVTTPAAGGGRRPKGILKAQASLARTASKARVSINLQDNEISRERSKLGSTAARSTTTATTTPAATQQLNGGAEGRRRSVEEVLREVGADIIGLQNVRAEEERGMSPLSELAEGLGMRYVFAESWAPEYGDAVLSRWPIKRWKSQRVADQSDFRCSKIAVTVAVGIRSLLHNPTRGNMITGNVLRATIEVPRAGEVNFHCTHLDHLDESWRMKQMNAILRSSDGPHILTGGLNALDGTDYSDERWADIVKYYEEIGKPTPKAEVMKYLKGKQYVDAKDFAGECEAVVVVAKGQDVQGTCKYGTRVDYILASPNSPYKFVPGSYTVISSKGTSDHHIVKVDVTIQDKKETDEESGNQRQRVVKINKKCSKKGLWAAK